jgi:hypothetical protein
MAITSFIGKSPFQGFGVKASVEQALNEPAGGTVVADTPPLIGHQGGGSDIPPELDFYAIPVDGDGSFLLSHQTSSSAPPVPVAKPPVHETLAAPVATSGGHGGIVVGAGLGFVAGGPIGAVVGAIVGALLK